MALAGTLRICSGAVPSFEKEFYEVNQYPLWIGEAQGALFGPDTSVFPGNFDMLVCGGFAKFPSVTKDCYARTMFRKGKASAWRKTASLPSPLTHMAVTSIGDTMYFCGGFNDAHPGESVSDCFSYNRVSDKWSTLPSLPGDRAGGGLVHLYGSKLLFAGGVDRPTKSNKNLKDHGNTWELDLKDVKAGWKGRAPIPNPRNHMGATTVICDGKRRHFFVGGQHKEDEAVANQASVSEYNAADGTWTKLAPIPKPTGHISSSVVAYGCGFLVIGGVYNGLVKSSDVRWYDAKADVWHHLGHLPSAAKTPVCGLRWNNLICVVHKKVYIAVLES